MKTKAIVRLKLSEQQRQIILDSLKPEVSNPASHRSRTSLYTKEELMILEIEAKDTTALRASLNSYLRWMSSILSVLKTLRAQQ
ncbi:MAG TPA: KEOPS complex subunit Pcc1 [Candidatus Eisenbacteria bacterium]|nr:KEOPS complex subunit Pcc1 [Candidatus Eisenbacteria bacterium]